MVLNDSYNYYLITFLIIFIYISCSTDNTTDVGGSIFTSVPPEVTNIDFSNNLAFDQEFNVYRYRNFYNGGGVAVGDISGNGLPDIFLTGNMVSNRLYLNKGDFEFEDITEQAGLSGSMPWSTGASFVDINGNGLLDIYVTNSGEFGIEKQRNELFINNGDLTFTEMAAEYGLDDPGYSIHAAFFDYNHNGFVDMYLLNNSDEAIGNFDLGNNQRFIRDALGGDKLFKNENGKFTDVSAEAGIYGSEIGFSLSASISDINRNGLPDIYIANDFFERDYLYLNNGDGTFNEVLEKQFGSISAASMGSDIADLTNNGWPDIYVSDMLPMTDERIKLITTFENWELFSDKIDYGYHKQLTRNTLQLNHGDSTFSEVGRLADVEATDWSWAVLMADFDHNGHNDIFVTNGLVQDITNLDYIEEINTPDMIRSIVSGVNVNYERLVDIIPSVPISNVMFSGEGDLNFTNRSEEWGLGEPGFSSGAAWGDLNGNGALDLVVNDVNGPVRIYRNHINERYPERSWIMVELAGTPPNTQAIGAQLEVWAGEQYWYREHFLQRGFQSSVAPGLHVGLGEVSRIDSLKVRWPDGRISRQQDIEVPARLNYSQEQASPAEPARPPSYAQQSAAYGFPLLEDITDQVGIDWRHRENEYVDFKREPLLVHMRSTEGPAMCTGDVTGNGLEDIYMGGARGQYGVFLLQTPSSGFIISRPETFVSDTASEDTDCVLADLNGNGHLDLYVTSGGNSYSTGASGLLDRLYLGDGQGEFSRNSQTFRSPGDFATNSTVAAADFTGNGALDLFVGERLKLFAVGMPARGFLLVNDGQGNFSDVTDQWAPDMAELGMVTDALWTDWDGDGRPDLVVVGEWMSPRLFRNTGQAMQEITESSGLAELSGWWNSVHAADLNANGRMDLILGNHGLNSLFRTSGEHPVKMWIGDFESNGMIDHILSIPRQDNDYPVALRHDLLEQLPSLREKYPDYASYAGQTVQKIFSPEQLSRASELQSSKLASLIIWNEEDGPRVEPLPQMAQFSPVYGLWSGDLTGNGLSEVIAAGNLMEVKPIAGPYDASYGAVITRDEENNLVDLNSRQSGLSVKGAVRNITSIKNDQGETLIIIARNNDMPVIYRTTKSE